MHSCISDPVATKTEGEEVAVQSQGAREMPRPLISEVVAAEVQCSEAVGGGEGGAYVSTERVFQLAALERQLLQTRRRGEEIILLQTIYDQAITHLVKLSSSEIVLVKIAFASNTRRLLEGGRQWEGKGREGGKKNNLFLALSTTGRWRLT